MNKSELPIPEELLSAFLDGELAEDERQRVELALAKSDELKTMLDELEQIRTEIQQLPRHTLSGDFATKIAQAAHTQAANNNTNEQPKTTVTVGSGVNSRTLRFRWVAESQRPQRQFWSHCGQLTLGKTLEMLP